MVIYKVTNLINGKVYVGKSVNGLNRRKRDHLWYAANNPTLHFHHALKKYGVKNFQWTVLFETESVEELAAQEIRFIKEFNSSDPQVGYNLTPGGDGAPVGDLNPSKRPEVREILRQRKSGFKHTEETKRKISQLCTGYRHTPEDRAKISVAVQARVSAMKAQSGALSKMSIPFRIFKPDGSTEDVLGLRGFCREHNLNPWLLRNKSHRGFKAVKL